MKHLFFLLSYVLSAGSLFAQSVSVRSDSASRYLVTQLSLYPQEKIYVQTDKPYYMAGDTIWLRAHVMDASTHHPVNLSKYVYVELLKQMPADAVPGESPEPLRIRLLEKEGIYAGYIPIPMASLGGDYTLSAYTLFMRNQSTDYFFRKGLHISAYGNRYEQQASDRNISHDYDVSFFPEGGYLLEGVRCCMGFKALQRDGTSIEITGSITDDTGQELTTFSSLHAGMGKVYFTPQAGRKYYAVCRDAANNTKRFRLPAARRDACILQLFPAPDRISVSIAAGKDFDTSGLSLLIQCRGQLCYFAPWDTARAYLAFDRATLPDGVLQLLLLDKAGNALSERLLFCFNEARQPLVTVVPDKPAYGPREKVTLTTLFRDADGNPLSGNFSVAVTDRRIVDPATPQNILTSLLVESELRGYIETPAFYFDAQSPTRQAAADALLLTQGWRRYNIPEVLRGRYTEPSEPLQIGQEIAGTIRKTGLFRKRNFKAYQVMMLAPARRVMASATVDSTGHFSLNGFDLPDSTLYVVRASGPDNKEDVELLINEERFPKIGKPVPMPDRSAAIQCYNDNLWSFTDSLKKHILLDEVTILGKRKKIFKTPYEVLSLQSFDDQEIERQNYNNLEEALRGRHGVTFSQNEIKVFRRSVAYVIDGVLWDPLEIMEGLTDKIPNFIPILMIKQIDIIPPVNTVLFGTKVEGRAVICITTKNGTELMKDALPRLNIKVSNPLGYQKPAEFYSPAYDTPERLKAPKRDLRTTLYWTPDLQVPSHGKATIEFYTTDMPADFSVTIEGAAISTDKLSPVKILNYGK